jgi:putative addiction module CopG family antidote
MSELLNVSLPDKLSRYAREIASNEGIYTSVDEYVRDLIRRDFERSQAQVWDGLHEELKEGIEAMESDFVPFDPEAIISEAHEKRSANAS